MSIVAGSLKKGSFVFFLGITLAILLVPISIWRLWTKDFYYGLTLLLFIFVCIDIAVEIPYWPYIFVVIPLMLAIAAVSFISARKEQGYERKIRAFFGYFFLFIGCTAITIFVDSSLT